MKQSSKRLVSIVGSLLLVIVALVIFFDLVQPEYANISEIKGTIIAENAILKTETQAVAAAQNVIAEYQQQSQGRTELDLALPTQEDVAGALAQIYTLASNNSVVIQSIAVGAPALGVATSSVSGATTKPYGTLSFQVSAGGSYEGLKNFIAGLETNVRVFDVKGVTITPMQSAASSKVALGSQDAFTYNITVATYYQTD